MCQFQDCPSAPPRRGNNSAVVKCFFESLGSDTNLSYVDFVEFTTGKLNAESLTMVLVLSFAKGLPRATPTGSRNPFERADLARVIRSLKESIAEMKKTVRTFRTAAAKVPAKSSTQDFKTAEMSVYCWVCAHLLVLRWLTRS